LPPVLRNQAVDKRKILIQLDTDPHPSVFDRVVAVDAGADELFSYGGVKPEHVRDLVHGAIFTRGPKDLQRTAIFIGGSDVAAAGKLLEEVKKHLLPQYGMSVSVMLDPNGANTTAAAAVYLAGQILKLGTARALVLAGTGPVGQRAALLLAQSGTQVRVASRQLERSSGVCEALRLRVPGAYLEPVAPGSLAELQAVLADRDLVIAAGAAGVQLLPLSVRRGAAELRVAIDLNAVPPPGIEGIDVMDRNKDRDGVTAFGAVGVGQTKMKLHRAAVAHLFDRNDQVLDAEEIFALAAKTLS
jgi:methylenetetrahydrofolate/methylenetetrahydromethanopterin dehydrogenase (NADP+)